MILYGIASVFSADVDDFHPTREEAEVVLAGILRDEPDWEGDVWVEEVGFETRVRTKRVASRLDELSFAAPGNGRG